MTPAGTQGTSFVCDEPNEMKDLYDPDTGCTYCHCVESTTTTTTTPPSRPSPPRPPQSPQPEGCPPNSCADLPDYIIQSCLDTGGQPTNIQYEYQPTIRVCSSLTDSWKSIPFGDPLQCLNCECDFPPPIPPICNVVVLLIHHAKKTKNENQL